MNDQTSYLCLFHSASEAEAAIRDLTEMGIHKASIDTIMGGAETDGVNRAALQKWGVSQPDGQYLMDEIDKGGTVIALTGNRENGDQIEAIFNRHNASQTNGAEAAPKRAAADMEKTSRAEAIVQDNLAIDVVEEQLVVGKRTVHTGGVRVFSRVVERPVNESVSLREEHIRVERQAVNRPLSDADGDVFRERNLELSEMGQEAVVSKSSRVVEEITVGKETLQHTEHIKESVRHTDVEVQPVEPEESRNAAQRK